MMIKSIHALESSLLSSDSWFVISINYTKIDRNYQKLIQHIYDYVSLIKSISSNIIQWARVGEKKNFIKTSHD